MTSLTQRLFRFGFILRKQDWVNPRWDLGLSKLKPEWKAMFSGKSLWNDLMAGVTVGCVAIPLSLAIALASKVSPGAGIVTSIVAGIVVAFFGGTALAVSGPAAAMAIIIADNVEKFGLRGLVIIGFLSGLMQFLCGFLGMGRLSRLVPSPVIAGFTAGIGAIIFIGQLPRALGLPAPEQSHIFDVVAHLTTYLHGTKPAELSLCLMSLVLTLYLPKVAPKIPGPLVAIGIPAIWVLLSGWDVPVIGEIPSGLPLPHLPNFDGAPLGALVASAFIVFAVGSLETLLSSSSVDRLVKGKRHDPDQELIGQGLGNIAVSCFGGIPITGVIARSALNVRAGAKTRMASVVHSLFLVATVFFLAPAMSRIPIASLAGLLIAIAFKMLHPAEFLHLWKVAKAEAWIFIITFLTIVFVDLLKGVNAGIFAALAISILRLGRTKILIHSTEMAKVKRLDLSGPLTFMSSPQIESLNQHLVGNGEGAAIVLEMGRTTWMDSSGAGMLVEFIRQAREQKTRVILQGLSKESRKTLVQVDTDCVLQGAFAVDESEVSKLIETTTPFSTRDRLEFGVQKFNFEKERYAPLFQKLADGQTPHTVFITCSDSRINPNLITSTDPGELFIVRNIGNMIPAEGVDATPAEGAAIEYAVGILGVQQIVVCGHTRCGAMQAVMDGNTNYPMVNKWLENATQLKQMSPAPQTADELGRWNLLLQLQHIASYPFVKTAIANGSLVLKGWIFDVSSAELYEWNENESGFQSMSSRKNSLAMPANWNSVIKKI